MFHILAPFSYPNPGCLHRLSSGQNSLIQYRYSTIVWSLNALICADRYTIYSYRLSTINTLRHAHFLALSNDWTQTLFFFF